MILNNLRNIFYSGSHAFRVDQQLLADINYLIESKLLFLNSEIIAAKVDYERYIDKINSGEIPVFDIDGGQIAHMALKLVGRDHLQKIGYANIKYEVEFAGYRPDIITADHKTIVECGSTNADKIFNYFKNKEVSQCIIIPYPVDEDGYIQAYSFKPNDDLNEFLIFRDEERIRELKKFSRK